ncbi:MAG: XrtA system polysaccharide chain length determinant [Thermodesulfobacteriota bacterium]
MESLDIRKLLSILFRRRWWAVVPFMATTILGFAYILTAPKVYEATTLILVQPQEVPEEYVRAIVSTGIEERLKTITEQVTSRSNLEKIIVDQDLFTSTPNAPSSMDERVAALRSRIEIDVSRSGSGRRAETNSFSITYRGKDPERVARITNALAENFISQNIQSREAQVSGTSDFLADKLENMKQRLLEKEAELKGYREKYMGGLPEQLEANLKTIERLQTQLNQVSAGLGEIRARKAVLEQEVARLMEPAPGDAGSNQKSTEETRLAQLQSDLAGLLSRYTESHPDVIRTRKEIAVLSKGVSDQRSREPLRSAEQIAAIKKARENLRGAEVEIASANAEVNRLESQIRDYQIKVEETPKREQELLALKRDYDNLHTLYSSLLSRKLESEISVSLEKRQQGEQLKVLDRAKVPSRPVKPNVTRLLLLTLGMGVALSLGFVYLAESTDNTLRSAGECHRSLGLPVLTTLSMQRTERERRKMVVRNIGGLIAACAVYLVILAILFFALKGQGSLAGMHF